MTGFVRVVDRVGFGISYGSHELPAIAYKLVHDDRR